MVGTEGARRALASSPRCCRPVPSTCPTGGGWSALVCNRRGQRGPGAAGGEEPARGNLGFCQSPPGAWKGLGALKAGGAEGGTTTTGRTLLAPPPTEGPAGPGGYGSASEAHLGLEVDAVLEGLLVVQRDAGIAAIVHQVVPVLHRHGGGRAGSRLRPRPRRASPPAAPGPAEPRGGAEPGQGSRVAGTRARPRFE